jgi:eukaryotic-like serine/threonine-protein kinase
MEERKVCNMNSYHFFLLIFVLVLTACSPAAISSPTVTQATLPGSTGTPIPESNITASAIATSSASDFDSTILNYRGNAQRTGVYHVQAIRKLPEIQWQSEISPMWLMPPMITDDILYTGGGDGSLYALDIQTGEEIWSARGFGQMEATGAIAGDILVAGGYSKLVQAFDRHDGEVLWTFNSSYSIQAPPLIVEGRVFIATDHMTYALDLQSGEVLWETATGDAGGFMGAPAFEKGAVYTTGGNRLLALDADTGEELWRVEHDSTYTAPAVANGFVYVGNFDHFLRAYEQNTGEERWEFEGGLFWSGPAIAGDMVYAGNDDQVYALDAQTGELRWSYKTAGKSVSEPVIVEDVVYVSDSSHEFPLGPRHLYALDAATGDELWVFETRSTFLPAPGVGEGAIYITTGGEVFKLR